MTTFDDNLKKRMDLDALRESAKGAGPRRMWRSLEELADTEEYRSYLHNEFPNDPEKEKGALQRRDMLKFMAASAALAGLSGCTKMPEQKIVPYVRAPEEIIPGKPLFYATTFVQGGVGTGVLVESHMGRPTKIEGNPLHPGSLGATDIFAQASILDLYDPDRSQVVVHEGRISSYAAFLSAGADLRTNLATTKGAGLRILTETVTSPTLGWQMQELLKEFPEARWHQWEPCSRDNVREGTKMAFGRYLNPVYRFDKADVILSLDSDFLYSGPGAVRYARDFASRRNAETSAARMNRLYVVEQGASTTGAMADHRKAIWATSFESFAELLAEKLGAKYWPETIRTSHKFGIPDDWVEALARDLRNHYGSSLVVPGEQQTAVVHALAHTMNAALGAVGNTVIYTDPLEVIPTNELESLKQLVDEMTGGKVQAIFIIGSNPAYSTPEDLNFTSALLRVPFRANLSLYEDETADLCHWHVPEAHYLESWGDAKAFDGTISFIQPVIAPLYDGKSAHEIVGALQGHADKTSHEILRQFWTTRKDDKNFEPFWETSLHDGVIAGTTLPQQEVVAQSESEADDTYLRNLSKDEKQKLKEWKKGPHPTIFGSILVTPDIIEFIFRPDPTIYDGRFANNGWLQETPKPISKLTWDNTVHLSPATAQKLGVVNGNVVQVSRGASSIESPVWVVPGQADDSVTLHVGYGRRRAGRLGTNTGFNAYRLQDSDWPWIAGTNALNHGIKITKTGKHYDLAVTQHHSMIDANGRKEELESVNAFERELVQVGTLEEFRRNPKFAQEKTEMPPKELSLYPGFDYKGYAWGMAIDLNKCNGCNACVVACQAENNIPVVGKEEVMAGREMHWLRVDTYFRGDLDAPETYFEPVPCMHCENAPCEGVCPVAATVHSPEGLNEMIYNRCVGTRYCSNNCPYKVRRFNFKLYSDFTTQSLMPLRNPNVTVRSRGVMEKCSYCVQRIQSAKIEAEKQDREVRDGEIVTACEAVCPAQAITFGNINDKNSRVAKAKASPRDYTLLPELNTRPRTSYLARLRNPNPEMPKDGKG
ncbi:MAG: TAT-variant-translocated molybdopterin oxidoreductase [Candidatus Acidiferrales bacterium]